MHIRITRRQALKWGLAGSTSLLLPPGLAGCGDQHVVVPPPASPTPAPGFLSAAERATLTAVTGRIIPSDDTPGAIEAGAAEYISRLLSFVPAPADPANVFAGGPFSDRNPFPDPITGKPSQHFPDNQFVNFIPLTRLQLLSWRAQLLGSDAVPGSDFNGPVAGLRDRYRAGLQEIEALSQQKFAAGFVELTAARQDAVLELVNADFMDLLTEHTIEGTFCAPEYGGNTDRIGWQIIDYDGDSQPLGYSIFNASTMEYEERPDKPNSTADPDEDFSGVSASTQAFLKALVKLVALASGQPYFPV